MVVESHSDDENSDRDEDTGYEMPSQIIVGFVGSDQEDSSENNIECWYNKTLLEISRQNRARRQRNNPALSEHDCSSTKNSFRNRSRDDNEDYRSFA